MPGTSPTRVPSTFAASSPTITWRLAGRPGSSVIAVRIFRVLAGR